MFKYIYEFESCLADFTNAPYVVTTDCCTHAIELCMILDNIKKCSFTCFTYISVLMLMHKLNINFDLKPIEWSGEYRFKGTRIWDSARRLEPGMYRKGSLQCLSFGYSKPLDIGRGGAILTDSKIDYEMLKKMRYDGRDLEISPWIQQECFNLGYHYKLNPEECKKGIKQLKKYRKRKNFSPEKIDYPDCRKIKIVNMR